ncbi:hypothetical protein [Polaromonas jejuensis]|uniref:Transposase n=1 Tax=Polaromonas jejuensis TaxID=457502 RepID=A0ABW0QB64_9BURK|nr:hypothetical protein [Polaromonas jejuensis]
MKSPLPEPSGKLASRLKARFFQPQSPPGPDEAAPSREVTTAPRRAVGFPASIAEFLLVFRLRLRVRRRSALSAEMLERAVRMVMVTCQNWFAPRDKPKSGPRQDA